MTNIPHIKLNNGVEIPQIGLGVWKVSNGQQAVDTVSYALKTGYRLIDTAKLYGNESSVGEAIKRSKLSREDIFVTTKLWNTDQGYESSLSAFEKSLNNLGLDYIDLYLIHWPSQDQNLITQTWQAFEFLYKNKKVRAIGVSNFKPPHLESLLKHAEITPAINQIELHPYNSQQSTRDYCTKHGIVVESWSPLMQGGQILEDEIVKNLATKYGKSPAQIILRWHIQTGFVVIPKSVTPSRIEENFDIFDFEISKQDMVKLNSLDKGRRVGPDPDGMAIKFYTAVSKRLKRFRS